MNNRRRNAVLQYINEHRKVVFSELYLTFDVSPATMRRDLTALEQKGLIKRTHGGAESLSPDSESSAFPKIDRRIGQCVAEKESIAHYALDLIQDGSSIILDASTTCLTLAQTIKVDGITPEKGLSNNQLDVIEWKKLIIKNSGVIYVLADHTKFHAAAILQIAPLSDITNVITDEKLPDELLDRFGEEKNKIIRLHGKPH